MTKTHLAMACPCCGDEVKSLRYHFTVIRPPLLSHWYVCRACEAALTGKDAAARQVIELAFMNYIDAKYNAAAA